MGKLRKSYNIYRISGLKSLWLAFNRDILNRDTRAEFARDHIRELNKKEDLAVAEVGVWKGEHADIIQRQLDVEKMYLIDPYDAYDEYNENKSDAEKMANAKKKAHERLSGYDNTVWIKKISSEAVKDITDSLDYVYIDGNHQYEYVLEDISKYYSLRNLGEH
jgi:hypothetical protein